MMEAKTAEGHNASGFADRWQEGKSLTECLRYSLDKKMLCDVKFKVGSDESEIEAHRLILSLRSCVFFSMFNGPMSEQSSIVIPEVDAEIFEVFLRYLYTDDVTITGNIVIGLLYMAKKYDVKTLEDQCLEYLTSSMTSENVCMILEQAHLYDEDGLKKRALTCIWEDGEAALKSASFVKLCQTCLLEILKSDRLTASEETVFQSVLTWSQTACTNLGREVTPHTRREALGDVFQQVRFPLLSQEYFVDNVSPTELLTESEEIRIMKHFVRPERDVSPFSAKPRDVVIGKERVIISRFCKSVVRTWPKKTNNSITFSINRNASLQGFQLYGATEETSAIHTINAFLTNADMCEIVDGSVIRETITATTETCDILFPQAIRVKKNVKYGLNVNIEVQQTSIDDSGYYGYYGCDGQSTVQHGVSFSCSFYNSKPSKHNTEPSNYTCVEKGQIPGLIFLV